ncbi:MAG: Uma2 family endonuclease [Acidobacteriota bacterium]|jgi:Uma2 family endonuclease|nr:Uma2 family endonuclease [Acidobacteriota bacterium]
MLPKGETKYTLEAYLELDHESEEKLEFWDGYVFTLAGASVNHNEIQTNLIFNLRTRLRERNCRIFPSDMRVKVPAYPPYRYPDISALCGEIEIETLGKQELLVNPQLLVEILSDSTSDFDQVDKFTYYKSVESFFEYILIAQHRPHVTQFIKQSDNSWLQHEFNDIDDTFHIASLDCDLDLSEIYENIEFPERSTRFDLISIRNDE